MADDKAKRGGADRALVALNWSRKLEITPAKLKATVAAAGHSSKKVEAYLAAHKAA